MVVTTFNNLQNVEPDSEGVNWEDCVMKRLISAIQGLLELNETANRRDRLK